MNEISQNTKYKLLSIVIWKIVENLVEFHSICVTTLHEWYDKNMT
jgi:hypothetical protein